MGTPHSFVIWLVDKIHSNNTSNGEGIYIGFSSNAMETPYSLVTWLMENIHLVTVMVEEFMLFGNATISGNTTFIDNSASDGVGVSAREISNVNNHLFHCMVTQLTVGGGL